ncbi:Microtubule-nucleating Tub4p (gamma-tubulin) complex component, partial [Coemansia helicoidea]
MEGSALDRTLLEYIGAFLGAAPAGDRDELDRRDSLMRYFHSIINGNFGPTASRNEELLVGEMQKRMMAGGRNVRAALHVSRLCGTLKQQDPDYDWWSVLYFLSECCAKTPGAAVAAPPSSYLADPQSRSLGAGGAVRAASLPQQQEPHLPHHANHLLPPQVRYGYDSGGSRPNTAGSSKRGSTAAAFAVPPQQRHRPEAGTPVSRQSLPEDQAGVFLHRELPTYDDVPEAELLQDLIYVMQGIDGTYVRWNRQTSAYVIRPDVNLSRPTRSMIGLLSELGVLVRDIQDYTDAVDQQGRLFEQGFCTELKAELVKYYQLVSETESKLFKAPRTLQPGESPLGATLRRMYNWTTEARQRLRLMATAIVKVQESRGGGDVLSIISTLVDDGDPFIQSFARRLLKTASVPFNSILVSWVTDGELIDPYGEFFIQERESRHGMLWGERYTVAPDMIPVHINRDMTRKIFQIGRSLNFLRVACSDAQWVAEGGPRMQLAGDISDTGNLETFVCSSSSMVNERLMSVLKTRFDLMGHV